MDRSEGCSRSPLACFYQGRATPLGIALEAKPPHSLSRSRLQPPMAPRSTAASRVGAGTVPVVDGHGVHQKSAIHHPGQGLQADHARLRGAHHLQMACSGLATVGLEKIFRVSYRIRLLETDEGWSVSCLDLPGCHSQGETRKEALQNIREAIGLWL